MFGGPDWLIWVVVATLCAGCAGACRIGWKRYRGIPGRARSEESLSGPPPRSELPESRARLAGESPDTGAPGKEVPKTPLEVLQERFVGGQITLEQYERELDKLEKFWDPEGHP
jgi:hypothetical protein